MKTYSIEWRGTITRDVGWVTVKAYSIREAQEKYESGNPTRKILSIEEVGGKFVGT